MTSFVRDDDRVKMTVSVGRSIREFLDELADSGRAKDRSAAVELAVDHYRAHLADNELAAAARDVDTATQTAAPGVIGPPAGSGPPASSDLVSGDEAEQRRGRFESLQDTHDEP